MGLAIDAFLNELESEPNIGGGALRDELWNLALAIQEDLKALEAGSTSPQSSEHSDSSEQATGVK